MDDNDGRTMRGKYGVMAEKNGTTENVPKMMNVEPGLCEKIVLLCKRLVGNDGALKRIHIIYGEHNDENLEVIVEAAKKNSTVNEVFVDGKSNGSLTDVAMTLLAALVSEHPRIERIRFEQITFGKLDPIVDAIQHNRNLTCIELVGCVVTVDVAKWICWLLEKSLVERLTLADMRLSDGMNKFDISTALENSRLKELRLLDQRNVFSCKTYEILPRWIKGNKNLEVIGLSLPDDNDNRFGIVGLVAEAATGHASMEEVDVSYAAWVGEEPMAAVEYNGSAKAIGTMVSNSPALLELSIFGWNIGPTGAQYLVKGLISDNSVVERLMLRQNNIGAEETTIFASLLPCCPSLKVLIMSHNKIGDVGVMGLSSELSMNTTVQYLDLERNEITDCGASSLAAGLVGNTCLRGLDLLGNDIGDKGAACIANMMTTNRSIETIRIGGFGQKGLDAFATHLTRMSGVKRISFGSGVAESFTSDIGNTFVRALHTNTTLEEMKFITTRTSIPVMPLINHLLALNHGGRRLLLATGDSVPPLNYWPRILARSSYDAIHNADVLFYFLREIPGVLLGPFTNVRKRKDRDDDKYGHH